MRVPEERVERLLEYVLPEEGPSYKGLLYFPVSNDRDRLAWREMLRAVGVAVLSRDVDAVERVVGERLEDVIGAIESFIERGNRSRTVSLLGTLFGKPRGRKQRGACWPVHVPLNEGVVLVGLLVASEVARRVEGGLYPAEALASFYFDRRYRRVVENSCLVLPRAIFRDRWGGPWELEVEVAGDDWLPGERAIREAVLRISQPCVCSG